MRCCYFCTSQLPNVLSLEEPSRISVDIGSINNCMLPFSIKHLPYWQSWWVQVQDSTTAIVYSCCTHDLCRHANPHLCYMLISSFSCLLLAVAQKACLCMQVKRCWCGVFIIVRVYCCTYYFLFVFVLLPFEGGVCSFGRPAVINRMTSYKSFIRAYRTMIHLALFPGPAQVFVACCTASDGKLGGTLEWGYDTAIVGAHAEL